MNNYVVYKHTSPSGKVYIGITGDDPKNRWKNGFGYYRQRLFFRSIQKYGWDNFKHEIIHTGLTEQEAKTREIELIALCKSNDRRFGYNTTLGGDGVRGYDPPQDVRDKISRANKGRKKPDTMRQRLSIAKTGTKASIEARRNMSLAHADISGERNPMYGKKHSEDVRRKMSENRKTKSVLQFGVDGQVLREYRAIRDAERITGINRSTIIRCCNGRSLTAGGYRWKYAEEVEAGCTISSKSNQE